MSVKASALVILKAIYGIYWLQAEGKRLILGLPVLTMVRTGVYTSYT